MYRVHCSPFLVQPHTIVQLLPQIHPKNRNKPCLTLFHSVVLSRVSRHFQNISFYSQETTLYMMQSNILTKQNSETAVNLHSGSFIDHFYVLHCKCCVLLCSLKSFKCPNFLQNAQNYMLCFKTTFLTFFCFFCDFLSVLSKRNFKGLHSLMGNAYSPVMCHAYDKKIRHKTTTKVVINIMS